MGQTQNTKQALFYIASGCVAHSPIMAGLKRFGFRARRGTPRLVTDGAALIMALQWCLKGVYGAEGTIGEKGRLNRRLICGALLAVWLYLDCLEKASFMHNLLLWNGVIFLLRGDHISHAHTAAAKMI